MSSLSVLIPARNEEFLARTIKNVLENIEGDTEVIATLDGAWADPPIEVDDRVTVIYHPESIGQRAATNEAARISQGDYVMKLDAHCAVDKGFDVKLMEECGDNWIVVPRMYNLHAFNWLCPACKGHWYQGRTPEKCRAGKDQKGCGHTGADFYRDILWRPRKSKRTDYARIDSDLRFKYWRGYERRPESEGDITDLMCFVGACWFLKRDYYWEIDGCDERHGSWGQQGVEMACKTWLSGGRVVVNKRTWFSHMFRTQGGDFGFPYPISGGDVSRARNHSEWLWLDGNWEHSIHKFSWLLEKFWPVEGWTEKQLEEQKRRENVRGDG